MRLKGHLTLRGGERIEDEVGCGSLEVRGAASVTSGEGELGGVEFGSAWVAMVCGMGCVYVASAVGGVGHVGVSRQASATRCGATWGRSRGGSSVGVSGAAKVRGAGLVLRGSGPRATRARTTCMAEDKPEKRAVPMTSQPNAQMRFLAILPYVLPLVEGLVFGRAVFNAFPVVALLLIPFSPMLTFYHSSSFTPFLVFFSLYLLVVRNVRIPHFIRFNAMQAILIDISQMLAGLIVSYLPREIAISVVGEAMSSMVFLGSLSAVGYSVYKSLCGVYADMPIVSEAVFIQVQA